MKKKAFFYIILAGILWGTSVIFANLLKPFGFTSVQMTFFRAVVSLVIMSGYGVAFNRKIFVVSFKELLLFAAIGISFFMTATFYYYSMQATSAATGVVLMYLAPAIVMVYSVLFFKEKLTIIKGLSVAGMLVGCFLVSGIIGGMVFDPFGIFVGVLSGITYGAYNILTKVATNRKGEPTSIILYCFLFAAIASFFVCQPTLAVEIIVQKPITFILVVLLGICTCILPYFFYTLGMKYLPAGTASAMGIVEPMSATLFGLVLGEKPGILPWVGIVLILVAIFSLGKAEK